LFIFKQKKAYNTPKRLEFRRVLFRSQEFKAWCDRYFYLPHRQEPRGVGGLFFDDLAGPDPAADFAFVRSVGEALLAVYPMIVARSEERRVGKECICWWE